LVVSKEATRGVAALGDVVVRTWITREASLPCFETVTRPTGQKSVSTALVCGKWHVPLTEGGHFSQETEETEVLPVGGLFLPVQIERTTRHETETSVVPVEQAALEQRLSELLFGEIDLEIANFGVKVLEIVDKWIEFSMIEEELYAYAAVEVRCQAAVPRDALSEGG